MTVRIKNDTFIHIPKTAGVSISRWLIEYAGGEYIGYKNPMIKKHMEYKDIIKEKGYHPEFMFAVVRNPWDRLVSGYHYYKKKGSPNFTWRTFDEFVTCKELGKLGRNQVHYIQNREGEIAVDLVIRFENLQEDFKHIQNRYHCYEPLTKNNVTSHRDYREYYTPETKDIVSRLFEADIHRFGYRF